MALLLVGQVIVEVLSVFVEYRGDLIFSDVLVIKNKALMVSPEDFLELRV